MKAVTGMIVAGVTNAGYRTLVSPILQGYDIDERIGRNVVMTSITMNGIVYASVLTGTEVIRILLVYDRAPNGAFPAVTDILVDTGTPGYNAYSPVRFDTQDRFQVLFDDLREVTNDPSNPDRVALLRYQECFELPQEWCASTATIADIRTGSLLLVAIASGGSTMQIRMGYETQYADY